jgi:hypothetical protein
MSNAAVCNALPIKVAMPVWRGSGKIYRLSNLHHPFTLAMDEIRVINR